MGGTRAISPRFRTSGRPRQGISPSSARREELGAFDQRLGVAVGFEPAEHIGPAAVAAHGAAQGAIAIGEAADAFDFEPGPFCRAVWSRARAEAQAVAHPRDRPAAGR